jgi:biotin transport system substrate-specific component
MTMQTFADLISPAALRNRRLVRDALLVVTGSALVALCAKIQVPSWPVPITMQPFAVLLVGMALGARRGGLALGLYLLEGAAGLPVFALPTAGLAYFAGPTAGYLVAFPLAAYMVGAMAERGWDRKFVPALVAMILGDLLILVVGFGWMAMQFGTSKAFAIGVGPFLPGELLKALLAAVALPAAWKLLRRMDESIDPTLRN